MARTKKKASFSKAASKPDESRVFENQIATSIAAMSAAGSYVVTTAEFDTDLAAWLVIQGSCHERWEVEWFDLIFKPLVGTGVKGQVGMYYLPDPNNATLPSTGAEAEQVSGSKAPGSVYLRQTTRYYPKKGKLFCYDTAGDRRFEMVGLIAVWTENGTTSDVPGTFHIRMNVRFYNPVPTSVHMTERSKDNLIKAFLNADTYQIPDRKVKNFEVPRLKVEKPLPVVVKVDHKFHPITITSGNPSDSKQEETPISKETQVGDAHLTGPGVMCVRKDGEFVPFAINYLYDRPFLEWKNEIAKTYRIIGCQAPFSTDPKPNF